MTTYMVCQSCAVLISNCDGSHIDPNQLPILLQAVKDLGLVFPVEVEEGQMFSCDCCGSRIYGEAHYYEGEDDKPLDYAPAEIDAYWLRDLRNILDDEYMSDAMKLEVIRDIMPADTRADSF